MKFICASSPLLSQLKMLGSSLLASITVLKKPKEKPLKKSKRKSNWKCKEISCLRKRTFRINWYIFLTTLKKSQKEQWIFLPSSLIKLSEEHIPSSTSSSISLRNIKRELLIWLRSLPDIGWVKAFTILRRGLTTTYLLSSLIFTLITQTNLLRGERIRPYSNTLSLSTLKTLIKSK